MRIAAAVGVEAAPFASGQLSAIVAVIALGEVITMTCPRRLMSLYRIWSRDAGASHATCLIVLTTFALATPATASATLPISM